MIVKQIRVGDYQYQIVFDRYKAIYQTGKFCTRCRQEMSFDKINQRTISSIMNLNDGRKIFLKSSLARKVINAADGEAYQTRLSCHICKAKNMAIRG